ncbi:PRC-barrel domain-containing protein [Bacillus subtilis]|uniref:PRC-barrel domain-containing protein n=1 Tax=Bacillus subtilis TaxID=1423 RepID=UPI002ADEE175|nr:PRC-barrel domain-containing protein [Bacillus subtilis]MEA1022067.1 PRC-barrel domain-containing protein [Bacillus subtilis]
MSLRRKAKPKPVQQKVVDHTLRTCHEVEGFPVYSERTSCYLGAISDICFSTKGDCLGFILAQKRFLHHHYALLRACDISSILDDRILASVSSEQLLPLPKTCFTYEQMKMKLVKSQEGDILGMLEDVYFCLDKGIIVAYELSDGFFSDLAGSKRQIQRADSLVEVRKDEIVLNG